MAYRLGVDVGGTFTDLLLIDEDTGATFRAKVPTTPANQAAAVLDGIGRVCAIAGIEPSALTELMHGTTVATNAVLEGKGARVGLITTEGYRQILQVARSYVPGGLAGWIIWPKPEPLAALEDTAEVRERIGARGEVVRELDEASAREALHHLKRRAVEAITVSLINAYANPAHERRVREIAKRQAAEVPVSISSEILPEMREYERTMTTVANSYVRPTVARYLSSFRSELKSRGVGALLKLLRSDGGLMSFRGGRGSAGQHAAQRTGGWRRGSAVGRQAGRLRQRAHARYGRDFDRCVSNRTRRAARAARDHGRQCRGARLVTGRALGRRRRRVDRQGAHAHARVAGGARERGSRARSGGLWPGWHAANGYRRQRGTRLSAGRFARRRDEARSPGGAKRGEEDRRPRSGSD